MVFESRVLADLMLSGADQTAWKAAIHDGNRLQKARPATATRVGSAVCQRLERLEPPFWQALRDGDDQLATQVAFCAALVCSALLVEFIETVVADVSSRERRSWKSTTGTIFLMSACAVMHRWPTGRAPPNAGGGCLPRRTQARTGRGDPAQQAYSPALM